MKIAGRTREGWELVFHLALATQVAYLAWFALRPLVTDDMWWHLALGRAYLAEGPWLAADPSLHTALGPPLPAAWLFDLCLFVLGDGWGLTSLRLLHGVLVGAALALAWAGFRRSTASSGGASLACAIFIALASIRLAQLRPELSTLIFTFGLYLVAIEPRGVLPWRKVGVVALGVGLWANLHAGFLLGPTLLLAAAGGAFAHGVLGKGPAAQEDLRRSMRLVLAALLAALTSLANPSGLSAHLAYLRSGADSPALAGVVDEWQPFDPFSLPVPGLEPALLPFALLWLLLLSTSILGVRCMLGWRRGEGDVDPALLALSAAAGVATLLAARFAWLGFFPLLLLLQGLRFGVCRLPGLTGWHGAAAGALCAVALVPAQLSWGSLAPYGQPTWVRFSEPYKASKYYAHLAWFLRDSGVRGNLYNAYFMGGFLDYWLSDDLRTFINGSLNVPAEVMDQYASIQHHGLERGAAIGPLLDAHAVDFFVGIGLPAVRETGAPWHYTAAHLERERDWMLVFRNLRGAVYMRRHPRNAENLERIARYYTEAGIPFDRGRGLDVGKVLNQAPEWAIAHGLVPVDYEGMVAATRGPAGPRRRAAARGLASTAAALGLYDAVLEIDAMAGAETPGSLRRRVFALLRLDRAAEAAAAGAALAASPRPDPATTQLVRLAAVYETLSTAQRATAAALVQVLTPAEADRLFTLQRKPESREP